MILSPILTTDPVKLERDLQFLMGCFCDVLDEAGEATLARSLPWTGNASLIDPDVSPDRVLQAYSIAFQLLSIVEQNAAVQQQRLVESENGLSAMQALWGQCLQQLLDRGITVEQIADALPHMRLDLVLTAHPTEAKRTIVLEHHRTLYLLLVKRENQMWTPFEQHAIGEEIKTVLSLLWRTGEIFLEKPDVSAERRNLMYYLYAAFPEVLPVLDRRLRQTWSFLELGDDRLRAPWTLPHLRLSTWVGGDRDGHPLVTPAVTADTLVNLRLQSLLLLRNHLTELARQSNLSDRLSPPPSALSARVTELATALGERGQQIVASEREGTWRPLLLLMIARLPLDRLFPDGSRLAYDDPAHYRNSAELVSDLRLLYDSLLKIGAWRLAEDGVGPLIRLAETFGFHLATLDVRQNSQFHDLAVGQLLTAAGFPDTNYQDWPEARRLAFLKRELASPRPFLRSGASAGPEADAVLDTYRTLADHVKRLGVDGLGALIVSMTRQLSDLLAPYLFAYEAGLTMETADGLGCPLQVTPLFETIDDLLRAPEILRAFLEDPVTKRSLPVQSRQTRQELVQQVVLGYSDSNKDGGILSSLWSLYRAEARLARVGRESGVRIRFLHGRGGSMSRGGGPEHRFVKAVHPLALNGDLRITEQGETIAQKYGNRLTAVYMLELLLAGLTRATLIEQYAPEPNPGLDATLDQLAASSHHTYGALLSREDFGTFYRQATPIDVIEESRIGSRPVLRSGKATLADLRAIPWVFSWSQSRFYLSAWYGVGSSLEALRADRPSEFKELSTHLYTWAPLHYLLSNVATCIAAADIEIMREYAALVEDPDIRTGIWTLVAEEFERTTRMLEAVYGGPLATRRPNIHDSLERRRGPLRILHRCQTKLLREWRALRRSGETDRAAERLPSLLLTVNAIASGLGVTG